VNQSWRNREFATVAPQQAFAHGEPIQRAALRLPPERLREASVAPIAAPPASMAAGARLPGGRGLDVPVERSVIGGEPTIGRPSVALPHSPGPRIAARGEPDPRFRTPLPAGAAQPQPPNAPHPEIAPPLPGGAIGRGTPEPQHVAPEQAQPEPRLATPTPPPHGGAPGPVILPGARDEPPPLRSREELQQHAMPAPGHAPPVAAPPTPQLVRPTPQLAPQLAPQVAPPAPSRDVPRGAYGSLPGQRFERSPDAATTAHPPPAPVQQPRIERAPVQIERTPPQHLQASPPPPQVRAPTPPPQPIPQVQHAPPHPAPPPPQPQARVAPSPPPPHPAAPPPPQPHPQVQAPQPHPQPAPPAHGHGPQDQQPH
jgi:hypothetical protein